MDNQVTTNGSNNPDAWLVHLALLRQAVTAAINAMPDAPEDVLDALIEQSHRLACTIKDARIGGLRGLAAKALLLEYARVEHWPELYDVLYDDAKQLLEREEITR